MKKEKDIEAIEELISVLQKLLKQTKENETRYSIILSVTSNEDDPDKTLDGVRIFSTDADLANNIHNLLDTFERYPKLQSAITTHVMLKLSGGNPIVARAMLDKFKDITVY